MAGFPRMNEKSGGSRARQTGGNLPADMSRFSHAGNNDATCTLHDQLTGTVKSCINPLFEQGDGFGFKTDGAACGFGKITGGHWLPKIFCQVYRQRSNAVSTGSDQGEAISAAMYRVSNCLALKDFENSGAMV